MYQLFANVHSLNSEYLCIAHVLFHKNEMLSDVWGWGVSECSGRPIFFFFIKENWICAMTRHHAEPNINLVYY